MIDYDILAVYCQVMASVRQRSESQFWYACITVELPDGTRRAKQFSTGLTDRAEALAVATAAERAAKKHKDAPHRLRAALESIADEYVPAGDADMPAWLESWAERRRGQVAASSYGAYKNTMTEAAEWLRERGIVRFANLTSRVIEDLQQHWSDLNSAATANAKIKHMRIALGRAMQEKRISENPATSVPALKTKAANRREFRPTELETLLGVVTGEWKAMTMLGLYTGQRMNDLASLHWRNIDLAAGTITLTTQKTHQLVSLPLMQPALDALADIPTSDDPNAKVFPGIAKLAPTSRSNKFRGILASVGLAKPVERRKTGRGARREMPELSFHSLRHTATSMLKAAGVSDSIARAIIGHQSEAVSRQYTHLDLDTMRQAMQKMTK